MAQKILVIDDKPFMVRLIQHHLEKAGYELIRARNGKEAMEKVGNEIPHLVVMDDSKGASGEGFKLNENGQPIPVIRMTDVPPTLMQHPPGTDSEVVLTRPFSPTHLVSEIKRLAPDKKCA